MSSELTPEEDEESQIDRDHEENMSVTCQLINLDPRGLIRGLTPESLQGPGTGWFMPRVITQISVWTPGPMYWSVVTSTHWSDECNPDTVLAALKSPVSGYPHAMPTMN